jgi:hypothetical protein
MRKLSILLLAFLLPQIGLLHRTASAQVVEWGQNVSDQSLYHYFGYGGYYGISEQATCIVTDPKGNAYIAGQSWGWIEIGKFKQAETAGACYLAKVAPSGEVLWCKTGPLLTGQYYYNSNASVVVDSIGGVYVHRSFIGTEATFAGNTVIGGSSRRYSTAIWKFDTGGTFQWSKLLGTFRDTASYTYNQSYSWYGSYYAGGSLQVDRAGNLYYYLIYEDSVRLLGHDYVYPKTRNGILAKLNKNGTQTWLREMKELDNAWQYYNIPYYRPASALAVTPTGHCYLTTRSIGKLQFDDTVISYQAQKSALLLKVTPQGELAWYKPIGWTGSYFEIASIRLTCDADEQLYLLAADGNWPVIIEDDSLGPVGIAKINDIGRKVWVKKIDRTDSSKILGLSYYTNASFSMNGYGQMGVVLAVGRSIKYDQHIVSRSDTSNPSWSSCVLQINHRGELIWGDVLEGGTGNWPAGVAMRFDHGVYTFGGYRGAVVGRDTLKGNTTYLFKYTGVDLMTPSPGKPEYCAGDTVLVNFAATRKFHPGNTYRAQLSDTAGVFNNKVKVIGAYATNDSLGVIECVLPNTITKTGTYRIKVTGTDPYFDATHEGPEFIIQGPPDIAIRAKASKLCLGESMGLSGIGGVSYLWSTGDTATTINVTKAGRYILTGYSKIGCVNYDTIDIQTIALPTATIQAAGATTFCDGGQVKLKAGGGAKYFWSTDETAQEITVRKSGHYSVTVTNAGGCNDQSDTIEVKVLEAPEKPTITRDSNLLISSSDEHNQWYYYGKPIDGATGKTYTAMQNGRYVVRVTLDDGCYAESVVENVTLGSSSVDGGADNVLSLSVVYSPEPQIVVDASSHAPVHVELVDILGRSVAQLHNGGVPEKLVLDLPLGIERGVYYVRAMMGDRVETVKLSVR